MAESSATYAQALSTASHIQCLLPKALQHPRVAIICGSGLGGLADTLNATTAEDGRVAIPYAEIPGFARSTVQGHAGNFVFGTIGASKTPVALLVGRVHYYEGHDMAAVTFATRVCKLLGVETMIVTNAAGGLNTRYAVGDVVCLNDHLNIAGLVGVHPLRGPNMEEFGVRFPPLSDAYDLDLRRRAHRAWKKTGLDKQKRQLHEGVYAFVAGPTYETRAECRMLAMLGADVVGMSTVPEVIVARHAGMRVLAFSLVTNNAVLEAGTLGDDPVIQDMTKAQLDAHLSQGKANHLEVLEAGREAAMDMQALIKHILEEIDQE